MTSDRLRDAIKAEPFRPFRIHLAGRSVDVGHPELVAVSPNGRTAVVFGAGDRLEIVDVLMIQSLEFLPPRGTARRRRPA